MALAYLTINLDAFTGDDRPPVSSYSTITLDPGADHIDAAADVIHVRSIVVSLDRQGKAATANGAPCVDGRVPVVAGVAYAVSAPNVLRGGPHYIPALTAGQVVDLSDYITPGAPLTPDQAAALTARIVALEATPPGGSGPLTGIGFPEGVITAPVGTEYVALNAPAGARRWLKTAGTGNTGWVVTYGDTGPRDVSALLTNGAARGGEPAPAGGYEKSILRRSGNVVTFTPKIAVTGWTNGQAFITIPTGFRSSEELMYLGPAYAGSPGQCILIGTGDVLLYNPPAATPGLRWSWTWHTSDPWPTTRPGDPA